MNDYIQSLVDSSDSDDNVTFENTPLNKKKGWTQQQLDDQYQLNYKITRFLYDQDEVDQYLKNVVEKMQQFYRLDPIYGVDDLRLVILDHMYRFQEVHKNKDDKFQLNEFPATTKYLLDWAFMIVAY